MQPDEVVFRAGEKEEGEEGDGQHLDGEGEPHDFVAGPVFVLEEHPRR